MPFYLPAMYTLYCVSKSQIRVKACEQNYANGPYQNTVACVAGL